MREGGGGGIWEDKLMVPEGRGRTFAFEKTPLKKKLCKLHKLQVLQPVGISYTLTTRLISCNSGKQYKCNAKILGLTKPLRNETMRCSLIHRW